MHAQNFDGKGVYTIYRALGKIKSEDARGLLAEVLKLLDIGIIYPISDNDWVSKVHVVPKKGGITLMPNENKKLIPARTITGRKVCIDYRQLNNATRNDHFLLPFIDQMLKRLAEL